MHAVESQLTAATKHVLIAVGRGIHTQTTTLQTKKQTNQKNERRIIVSLPGFDCCQNCDARDGLMCDV